MMLGNRDPVEAQFVCKLQVCQPTEYRALSDLQIVETRRHRPSGRGGATVTYGIKKRRLHGVCLGIVSAVDTDPSRRKNSHTSAKPSKATTDSVPAKTDRASPIAVVVAPNTRSDSRATSVGAMAVP